MDRRSSHSRTPLATPIQVNHAQANPDERPLSGKVTPARYVDPRATPLARTPDGRQSSACRSFTPLSQSNLARWGIVETTPIPFGM